MAIQTQIKIQSYTGISITKTDSEADAYFRQIARIAALSALHFCSASETSKLHKYKSPLVLPENVGKGHSVNVTAGGHIFSTVGTAGELAQLINNNVRQTSIRPNT